MKLDENILFEMVYDRKLNYELFENKIIDKISIDNDILYFVFQGVKEYRIIREMFALDKSEYNNKLRLKKLDSL